uniref:Uncharacterized protein n=1 Tax=Arundo donax TaxID=35708 RepID=A0A0A9CA65_ARUDO
MGYFVSNQVIQFHSALAISIHVVVKKPVLILVALLLQSKKGYNWQPLPSPTQFALLFFCLVYAD